MEHDGALPNTNAVAASSHEALFGPASSTEPMELDGPQSSSNTVSRPITVAQHASTTNDASTSATSEVAGAPSFGTGAGSRRSSSSNFRSDNDTMSPQQQRKRSRVDFDVDDLRSVTQAHTTPQGVGYTGGAHNSNTQSSSRILCPVDRCPESLPSSNRHFRDFYSIRSHLNDHCTGHLSGALPAEFLSLFDYSQCRLCDKILHKRFNNTCQKCRPRARAQANVNIMRCRTTTSDINGPIIQNS